MALVNRHLWLVQHTRYWFGLLKRNFGFAPLLGIVSLTIIFETGPILQQYVFSVGSASRPSLYAAVYGNDVIDFYTFRQWLINWDSAIFFVVSTIVYIYSDAAKRAIDYIVRFVSASFLVLTLSPTRQFSVDGQKPEMLPTSAVWISGDLEGQFDETGRFFAKGTGEHVWLDGRRVNKTLWERVPNDWAIYVTGLLLVGLGVVLRGIRKFMKGKWELVPSSLLREHASARISLL